MNTSSLELHESLFASDKAQDWADAKPRVYSRAQMKALLAQLEGLGFRRLGEGAEIASVKINSGVTPWDALLPSTPEDLLAHRQGILALGVLAGPSLEEKIVLPGFLRNVEGWYLSGDGLRFDRDFPSTVAWRMGGKA
jgi:hypothetical protein